MNERTLLVRPSAVLPVAMSLGALATIAAALAVHGPAPQADEGTAARVWQLLMAGQVPVVAWFAARWVPRFPSKAVPVLVVQLVAALAAAAPVFLLGW